MFCPKCGTQLPDDSQFCSGCGTQIGVAAGSSGVSADPGVAPTAASVASATSVAATPAKSGISPKLIGLIAVALLALLVVFFGMKMCSGGSSGTSGGSVGGGLSSGTSGGSVGGGLSSGTSGGSVGGGLLGPKVEEKAALADYSWEELSIISSEIAKAGSEEDAVKVAANYNLVGLDGKLDGSQVKLVSMGGSQVPVQIIGFAHDDKTGGGKAGITFQFVDCIAEHEMNPLSNEESAYNEYAESWETSLSGVSSRWPDGVPTNAGGWEASSMRNWLNEDVFSRLPEDLSAVIVPVDKQTNNTGWTEDVASVTTTSDSLWLPSVHELCGDVDWYSDQVYNDILNAEGMEYKLFRDMNVDPSASNEILVKRYNGGSCYWWERSPYPDTSDSFRGVYSFGSPGYFDHAFRSYGVAPGFCI